MISGDQQAVAQYPKTETAALTGETQIGITDGVIIEEERGTSIFFGASTLANTTLGLGLLGLSFAFSQVGWLLGIFMLIIASTASGFTLHLLSASALKVGGNDVTLFKLAMYALPPSCKYALDLAMVIKCIGVCTSYLIVLGDAFPKLLHMINLKPSENVMSDGMFRALVLFLVVLLLVTPASIPKRIRSLRHTNWVSMACMAYLALLIIIGYIVKVINDDESLPIEPLRKGPLGGRAVLSKLPVFIFAFTCHQNILTVSNELKRRTLSRMNMVIISAMLVSSSCYLAPAMMGYAQFGDDTNVDILKNFGQGKLAFIAKFGISLSMVFSYPLQCHPARTSLRMCVFQNKVFDRATERQVLRVLTICIILLTYTIAAVITDLGVVFGIVGSVASNAICYLIPAVIYMRLFKDSPWTTTKIGTVIIFLSGMLIMPMCLAATILDFMAKNN
eukprot:GHVR01180784.1.p1 GENE.GHVR01180784.1~~GHVR01180784.1.p1  ORF type:complete len:448 (+),score=81.90 GHVR01180784.1:56-1399(+)